MIPFILTLYLPKLFKYLSFLTCYFASLALKSFRKDSGEAFKKLNFPLGSLCYRSVGYSKELFPWCLANMMQLSSASLPSQKLFLSPRQLDNQRLILDFPGGSMVKNLPANAGDWDQIPGSGISPGEGNGKPFQCSCLENPIDNGACWATIHRVAKEADATEHSTLFLKLTHSSGLKIK